MIFLCVRSPEAPKTTSAHGSGVRRRARPSASGFSFCTGCSAVVSVTVPCSLFRALLEVAAEGVPHRRQNAVAEVRLAAGGKPVEQRGGEHRSRHSLLDGGRHRPPALAR